MRPLYESWNPVTLRSTTVETDSETGLPIITQVQDTAPIVESAKAIASTADPSAAWRRNGMVHVARVPLVVWQRWERIGITKDPQALNAMLDSRECRLFRTDDGRKI